MSQDPASTPAAPASGGLFRRLYDWMLRASRHRHAERYLAGVAFAESSFFPLPPDLMLVPMSFATPERWWRLALITTVGSLCGGLLGWCIGAFALQMAMPVIEAAGYLHAYQVTQVWFSEYGVWAVFIAGFTPIPYKVFTISAGAVLMPIFPFAVASLVGRGARFFLVAGLIRLVGPRVEAQVTRYIDWLGWATIGLLVLGFATLKLI